MACFANQMGTVENQRSRAVFNDDLGAYPVIQGISIEDMLTGAGPDLPLYGRERPAKLFAV